MQEKIKGYLGKVAGWWKAAGKKVKLFLIAGLIAVVAVVAVVLAMQMNQPYTTLFTGLNQTELNEIVSYLSEQGMADYRIEGSDTILVPAEQEDLISPVWIWEISLEIFLVISSAVAEEAAMPEEMVQDRVQTFVPVSVSHLMMPSVV